MEPPKRKRKRYRKHASKKPSNIVAAESDESCCDENPEIEKPKFLSDEERKNYLESYSMKFKTELCKNFNTTGSCEFGKFCSFAHGEEELLQKTIIDGQFKSKPCEEF